MADWFVEVARLEDTEVFEFIDYRKALAFGPQFLNDPSVLAVELVDVDGRIVLQFADDEFDGSHGWSTTPRRAGMYRWDPRTEQMRQVSS